MRLEKSSIRIPIYRFRFEGNVHHTIHRLLPTPGNVLFTLLVMAGLLWAQSAGALPLHSSLGAPRSTGAIAYQGRLADADGNPLTGTYNMIFRLYDVPTGGAPLWEEQWTGSNGVKVSDGLFNVMLGSLNPIGADVIAGRDQLWLGITVGTDDEMAPRVQLGSVPFAVQASTLADGAMVQGDFSVLGNMEIGTANSAVMLNVNGVIEGNAYGRTLRPAAVSTTTIVSENIPNDGVYYPVLEIRLDLSSKSDLYAFYSVTCSLKGYRTWNGIYLDGDSNETGWTESDSIGVFTFTGSAMWNDVSPGSRTIQVRQARRYQTDSNHCWRGKLSVRFYPVE